MTREEILALSAGRELDALVAEKVLEEDPSVMPFYSSDMNAAWEVMQHCRDWIFSRRQLFLLELARLCQGEPREGYFIAWPDALMHLCPEFICRAALLAVRDR